MKLTRLELIDILDLHKAVVQNWKKQGLRVASQLTGLPGANTDQFDSGDILAFLTEKCLHGYQAQRKRYDERLIKFRLFLKASDEKRNEKKGLLKKKVRSKTNVASSQCKSASAKTRKKAKSNGELKLDPDADISEISDMLTRVREAEKSSHDAWKESSKEENPIAEINLQKIWMEFIANRTKLEKQIPDILLSKKLYRPVDEIRRNCARIGTIFKNSLLGSGAKVRAQISTLVRNQEDAVLIEGMITKNNKDALHKAMEDLGEV